VDCTFIKMHGATIKTAGSVHWSWKIFGIDTRRKPTTTIRSGQQNWVTQCHYFYYNTCTNIIW